MIHYHTKHDQLSSHQQIVRIIKQLHQDPILDVGSAQGMLGQALSGSGLAIDAIEPDPRWAEAAKQFYRTVTNSTIENANLPAEHYRIVVCADVLEHVPDPVSALKQLRAAATRNTTFIISLPNVAHLSIRLMLLAGLFPRMERGILDKTHLQFFTRSTALAMLAQAGLKAREVYATPVPVEQITSSAILRTAGSVVQRALLFSLPRLFAFQWIFVAEGENA